MAASKLVPSSERSGEMVERVSIKQQIQIDYFCRAGPNGNRIDGDALKASSSGRTPLAAANLYVDYQHGNWQARGQDSEGMWPGSGSKHQKGFRGCHPGIECEKRTCDLIHYIASVA